MLTNGCRRRLSISVFCRDYLTFAGTLLMVRMLSASAGQSALRDISIAHCRGSGWSVAAFSDQARLFANADGDGSPRSSVSGHRRRHLAVLASYRYLNAKTLSPVKISCSDSVLGEGSAHGHGTN